LVVSICSLTSLLINQVVHEEGFRFGGYGYIGFCSDSVALVEAAAAIGCGAYKKDTRRIISMTNVFPLMHTGAAKSDLLRASRNLKVVLGSSDPRISALRCIYQAISVLDDDINISPSYYKDVCQRIDKALPLSSPFNVVHKVRRQCKQLEKHIEEEERRVF